jgi:Ca-activated chloride channel homolog
MRRMLAVMTVLIVSAGAARANGIVIPEDKTVPPLGMLSHHVSVTIQDQVAVTDVEQVFRNNTPQALEAIYIFPVPRGASIRQFSTWINGKEITGELLEADKARKIYTEIVSRTMDPALLEYIGNNLLRVKLHAIPPMSDQKIKLSFTSIATSDHGMVEYVYPLKTDGRALKTLEKFSLTVQLKAQHAIQNIYSPTHNITLARPNDKEATVKFEKDQAILDKDFQLYYTASNKDVGLTAMTHRPDPQNPGYFMLLAAPRVELSKEQVIPRDMVFVLDTSGSMKGKRMTQARNALKYCLNQLNAKDRFALIDFSTGVRLYKRDLLDASPTNVGEALKWVEKLQASGGTAIDAALAKALSLRTEDESRPFTVVFFTDGEPTVGETNPEAILKNVSQRNTASTRIFTFGVLGTDDVNITLLDRLADTTRGVSTYVRDTEDIEVKVSSLYAKISNPVLSNLKLTVSKGVELNEIYPPNLPDLFHGTQLVVLGRYEGDGPATIKLTGNVGKEVKEFVYDLKFPAKTGDDRPFVEDLWARRKVGYLLDQIRVNGDKKELVDEVISLAKRYGITTPYTSYLIVTDSPVVGMGGFGGFAETPAGLKAGGGAGGQMKVNDFAKNLGGDGKLAEQRRQLEAERLQKDAAGAGPAGAPAAGRAKAAQGQLQQLDETKKAMDKKDLSTLQSGTLACDISSYNYTLRNGSQVCQTAVRRANARNCLEVGGVWVDDGYTTKMETVTVKAMSTAYFRLLEKQPKMREVFSLGNHIVWVTPSGKALVIDTNDGVSTLEDNAIEALFVPAKK